MTENMSQSGRSDTSWVEHVRPEEWKNPKPRDRYDLVIIGAGPAGLAAAEHARRLGLSVALIEKKWIGGNSLNHGSIPSKAIIRSASMYAGVRRANESGAIDCGEVKPCWDTVKSRMREVRSRIASYHSVERLQTIGVDIYFGQARFASVRSVIVDSVELFFRKALIATGARPQLIDLPGLADAGFQTSDTIFELNKLPKRLAVIGGGPLGCEIAQAFQRMGSQVVIIQDDSKFLPHEERDAAELLSMALARDGVEIRLNTAALGARQEGDVKFVDTLNNELKYAITADEIFLSVGREPNIEGLELQVAGIAADPALGVKTNDFLQTANRNVYAAGDICMPDQLTNVARTSGHMVVENAFRKGKWRRSKLMIPWCTYCDPEIAHVGMHVWEARLRSISIKTFTIMMQDVDRAITDGQDYGFVKIHLKEGTDKILGATIVALRASEMINEICLAMKANVGMTELARVVHAYPSQSDAIRMAALAYMNTQRGWAKRSSRR